MRAGLGAAVAVGVALVIVAPVAAQQVVRLPEKDQPLAGRLEAVYTVGKEEGEDHEVFSSVPAVAFDAESNLYVLDQGNARVLVFGPTGRFVRQIGRHGEGPGELRIPTGLAVTADGRVAVYDMANRAISLFDRNGTYLSLARFQGRFGAPQSDLRAHPRGGVLAPGSQLAMVMDGPPTVRDSVPILLLPLTDGAAERVVFQAPSPAPIVNTAGGGNRVEVRVSQPPTFSPRVYWGPLPDGRLAVVWGTDWRVHLTNANGAVARVLERPIRARPVTDKDKQAARDAQRERLESGTGAVRIENVGGRERMTVGGRGAVSPEDIERILATMQFAETVPVIRGMRTDPEGRLWIQRDGGPGSDDYPIDLVSADGRYIGTISGEPLPNGFGPNGLVALVVADELGVQRVAVKRVARAWGR
jgi:hypothetical protein